MIKKVDTVYCSASGWQNSDAAERIETALEKIMNDPENEGKNLLITIEEVTTLT